MTSENAVRAPARRPLPVDRVLRPRSIAIVGISPAPGSVGAGVLGNLERFKYAGDIHLVSRNRSEINGRPCLATIDELPEGVDVVVLGVPRTAVLDAVRACVRRRAGAAFIFASGFAESGEEGKAMQAAVAEAAREGGLLVAGPNFIGLTNFLDGVPLTFAHVFPVPVTSDRALAIVAQSGAMMANVRSACIARGVPVAYALSTGNEAVLGIEDYIAHLIAVDRVGVIGLFVEHLRHPALFVELAARARAAGKSIVMLHPGRSSAARAAAMSHTGALTADYAVMRTHVENEAVAMVDSMEELVDVCVLLTRFPQAPTAGAAMLTDSGAFKGFALDFCDEQGLELPGLAKQTRDALDAVLPEFAETGNPLDITAQGILNPQLYGDSAAALLADPNCGSLIISIMPGAPQVGLKIGRGMLPALAATSRPVAYAIMGGDSPLSDELLAEIRAQQIPFFRSPERAMRAMARLTSYGRALKALRSRVPSAPPAVPSPLPVPGVMPEYLGKSWLAGLGIPVPESGLARDADGAEAIAGRIGYPVVLKAQAAALAHKSDAGGVITGIGDGAALRAAWSELKANIARSRPGLELDGVLVERMAAPGIEMVVGARRVADWGPVLMLGLGGVWIEILEDVCLLPADAGEDRIAEAVRGLRAARLLLGARGGAVADIPALARVAAKLGALIRAMPRLQEIELNPLRVYPQGEGVLALDALVVSDAQAQG